MFFLTQKPQYLFWGPSSLPWVSAGVLARVIDRSLPASAQSKNERSYVIPPTLLPSWRGRNIFFFFLHPVFFELIYLNFSSTPSSLKWWFVTFMPNWSFCKVSCCSRSKIEAITPKSRNSYGWGFASFSLCMCSMQRALLMALVFRYYIQHSAVTGRFICYVTLLGAAWILHLLWLVVSFPSHCWSASRIHRTQQWNVPELLAPSLWRNRLQA